MNNIWSKKPITGDRSPTHTFEIDTIIDEQPTELRRCWKNYNIPTLLNNLTQISWDSTETNTQQIWNEIENKLIKVVDIVAPMVEFKNNLTVDSQKNTSHHKTQIESKEATT